MRFIKVLLVLSTFLLLSHTSQASLIVNGSFEELVFSDNTESTGLVHNTNLIDFEYKNRAWDVFYTLPGWFTSDGNGIELQKNVVTQSQDGQHHVELDSHPRNGSNSVMTQTLTSLTVGADYLLEFYYKPRTNRVNDNGINVFWSNTIAQLDLFPVFIIDSTKRMTRDWEQQSLLITADSETMNLSFGAFGVQNRLGGLIDNISLIQVSNFVEVPEPSTLLIFGLIIAFLIHRKNNKAVIN